MTATTESRESSPMLPINNPTCTHQDLETTLTIGAHAQLWFKMSCLCSSAVPEVLPKSAADALINLDGPHRSIHDPRALICSV